MFSEPRLVKTILRATTSQNDGWSHELVNLLHRRADQGASREPNCRFVSAIEYGLENLEFHGNSTGFIENTSVQSFGLESQLQKQKGPSVRRS